MNSIEQKFAEIAADYAPGQEKLTRSGDTSEGRRGENLPGAPVDFSHGDVDAFTPTPGSFEVFAEGVRAGAKQAYTVYRGKEEIRSQLAERIARFTGSPVDALKELIITPGSQGALFLAVASCVTAGDKIAIVEPDYFANRKIARFLGAEVLPVRLDYLGSRVGGDGAGLDLAQLENAFKAGVKAFLFSNPNNPSGVVYTDGEIRAIAKLAAKYGATLIADELYSRMIYDGRPYTHTRAPGVYPENCITLLGPSKTESLSGYRLGVGIGPAKLIDRMEKLQAIVSLRAAGYNQAVLATWFAEPEGWLADRVRRHQAIRDDLVNAFAAMDGVAVRPTEAGCYLFPRLPDLALPIQAFTRMVREQAAVTVTPGTEFAPHTADSIRLNFSQNREAALDAVARLGVMVQRYRK